MRALLAFGVVAVFGGLLLARGGTSLARLAALVVVVIPFLAYSGLWRRTRDAMSSPEKTIVRLAGRIDPVATGRAVRALGLEADGATSSELAELHVDRSLRALPRERILGRAASLAQRYGRVTLVLGFLAAALGATRGFAILEGADVLLARQHKAPLRIVWLDRLDIEARPPDYLHEHDRMESPYAPLALPHGTALTFRGEPLHAGHRLFLKSGPREVPFVDDGAGYVVARWVVTKSEVLSVVARFGDVDIDEPEVTPVTAIEDEAPTVVVEKAPREVRLADVSLSTAIPVAYEVTDDHGLREVQLVLRSGAREERRILAHLDGETEVSRGGYTLRANDPFLKKSHASVEVTVEAEDNDPVTGPKWGKSAAITVIPPEAGEPEALRLAALYKLRDAFVDSLAARIGQSFAVPAKDRPPLAAADQAQVTRDAELLEETASASYAGARLSGRLLALLRGYLRRVREAAIAETKSPGVPSHARLIGATERLVLVTDGVLHGLAQKDARSVAKNLADVADDLMLGIAETRRAEEHDHGIVRTEASLVVLAGGGRSLLQLGSLGRDLGEIVGMDLGRVGRARAMEDTVHAEIAASDLAARLKNADPSFGAQGGSGGRAGGESGGGQGTPSEGQSGDDAERGFDEAAHELGQLSSDHGEEVARLSELSDSLASDDQEASADEAKSHARAVREAARRLPSVGAGSDSWTNKGASARELGEQMARALEKGSMAEAVQSGKSALDALDEARHVAQRERVTGLLRAPDLDLDRGAADARLRAVKEKLEPEIEWAGEQLRAMKKGAAQRKAAELSAHGELEERLADRAGKLRESGGGERALPDSSLDALRDAERAAKGAAAALKRGDVDEGLTKEREAQRRLEAARDALGNDTGERNEEAGHGDGAEAGPGHAEIPNAGEHKGPEEFRRRVLSGLGTATSGRQRDAVRRYADGLLR